MRNLRILPAYAAALAAGLVFAGCQAMQKVTAGAAKVGAATGVITENQAKSLTRVAASTAKAFEKMTPEQEYYIGRSVAATLLHSYKAYDNEAANGYLNRLGQTLALASAKPETFAGYHFLVMDSEEINAFAAPGGLILVSRGLLRCARGEDAVAAVLAHEIGHVQCEHGLKAIEKGRFTDAVLTATAEGAKTFGGEKLAEATKAFEGGISDIVGTLVSRGYSRQSESEADRAAVDILVATGYNPSALADMLRMMSQQIKPGHGGFAKTHPDPLDRVRDITPLLSGAGPVSPPPARQGRFEAALKGI